MTGQTADIRNIYEYSCYEWFMFCDKHITYTDYPLILERYLGLDIDIRSDMTYKILKANSKYACRTTVRSLDPTELACSKHKQSRDKYNAYVLESLGRTATISDFDHK